MAAARGVGGVDAGIAKGWNWMEWAGCWEEKIEHGGQLENGDW